MPQQIQLRRGTRTQWDAVGTSAVLLPGEIGVETDTRKFKVGDGSTLWNSLAYASVSNRGAWSAGTYYAGDIVTYQSQSYIATATTAQTPGGTGWSLLAAKGADGANGTRTAVLEMYQWASSVPTTFPSGTSTYTWATGAFTAPATANSWTLTPGTGTPGQTLYMVLQVFSDTNTTATSTVTWSASTASPLGYAGTNGTNGTNGASFTWRGAWSSATAYAINDVVSYNNESYIAVASSTNQQPSTSGTVNTSYWNFMAAKGADGEVSLSGVQTLSNKIIASAKYTVSALGSISGVNTLDLATATEFTATLTGATTFAFSNAPGANQSQVVYLRLTNAGATTITWPTNTKFAGGTLPSLTGSGVDVLAVKYDLATTTYQVFVIGLDVK